LQNIPSFNIYQVHPDGLEVSPWYEVTSLIAHQLVLNELDLPHQVQTIASEIQKWGRLQAMAQRVWEIEERGYRSWKARFYLKAKEDSEKKLTEATIKAMYQTDPEYGVWNSRIERAEEAHRATSAVLDGFRAKKEALLRFAFRDRESGAPRLSV
jgi:hypothetical protein